MAVVAACSIDLCIN